MPALMTVQRYVIRYDDQWRYRSFFMSLRIRFDEGSRNSTIYPDTAMLLDFNEATEWCPLLYNAPTVTVGKGRCITVRDVLSVLHGANRQDLIHFLVSAIRDVDRDFKVALPIKIHWEESIQNWKEADRYKKIHQMVTTC